MALLALLVTMMLGLFSGVSTLWGDFQARKSREQTARIALEAISRDLRTAAFPTGTQVGESLSFLISPTSVGSAFLSPDAAFWQSRNPVSPVGFLDVGYFVRWDGDHAELCQLRIPHDDADSIFTDLGRSISPAVLNRLAPGSSDADLRGFLAEHVVGLWLVPMDRDGNALSSPYDSRSAGDRPAFVEVSLAVIDPATATRLGNAATIRGAYASRPEDFLSALPAPLARGVRIFTERIPIHANP